MNSLIRFKRWESLFIKLRQLLKTNVRHFSTGTSQKPGWEERLRILFCGTDVFSIESLKALHRESKESDTQISSIDVVTKKDQRTGRGLKNITPPPIKKTATDLGLPLHQIDTFRGWTPPDTSLIVAVSFGLLIPPRILGASKYGGLNVHPSMLPDLRGAAPIQWTIILGRQHTGVSLQTLHPINFDEGIVLDQTRAPGLAVPCGVSQGELSSHLASLGAEMLVKAIRNRLYIPPYKSIAHKPKVVDFAARLRSEHKAMNFDTMDRFDFYRKSQALGSLHAFAETEDGKHLRVVCEKICTATSNYDLVDQIRDHSTEQWTLRSTVPVGVPYAFVSVGTDVHGCLQNLLVNTKDGGLIYIPTMTVEGKQSGPAAQRAAQAKLFGPPQQLPGANEYDQGSVFYQFLKPLKISIESPVRHPP